MKANTSVVNVLFNQQNCFIMPNLVYQANSIQDKQKRRFSVIL